ncbi:MAG: glycosyltransferase [Planctomycetota bacterium]
MRIVLTDPSLPDLRAGNHSTVKRWATQLRKLGHKVDVYRVRDPQSGDLPIGDLLIGLHAGHSHGAIQQWKCRDAKAPVVVALSGTDLHQELPAGGNRGRKVRESLKAAVAVVALHRHAKQFLPADLVSSLTHGIHFIPQSARALPQKRKPIESVFRLLVIGYLRAVKDPLLPLKALQHLPRQFSDGQNIEIIHLGAALDANWQRRGESAARSEPRWRWLGAVSRAQVRRYLSSSHLLIHPSLEEGGANVISEGLVARIPILASDAAGNLGLLGNQYPGLFERGDAMALAGKISRWKSDHRFRTRLQQHAERLRCDHTPDAEIAAWSRFMADMGYK